MKVFILCLTLMSLTQAQAAKNVPLDIEKIFQDGKQFVFLRTDGELPLNHITIKDAQSKEVLFKAQVKKCGPTKCLALIEENLSGLPLSQQMTYVHSYRAAKAPAKNKIEKSKADISPETSTGPQVFAGYGSPLGPAFSLGYFNQLTDKVRWGARYSHVSTSASSVGLKAEYLAGTLLGPLIEFSDTINLNLLAELGFLKSNLDFGKVNAQGPKVSETTYVLAVGAEGNVQVSEKFALALRFGFSKNGQKANYEETNGTYHNPYSKPLVFAEAGVYYAF